MSEREFTRRNILANRRTIGSTRAPRSSPETHRRINSKKGGHLSRLSEYDKVLKSSKSEPLLWNSGVEEAAVVEEEEEAGVLYRPQTCRDIFSSRPVSEHQSPRRCPQVYKKDAKVVVNVTVEGSPGPVRTMVKLGSNVEETIKLVINKYNEERRTPHLDYKDAATKYELHLSNFSLESLSQSDLIGDVGGRSFYLRKCSSNGSRAEDVSTSSDQLPVASSLSFLPGFIGPKITIIIRRTRKFWELFGCIP